ncbi:TetR family transcriptional regulator [Streptomyces agglomeratus]|uniref:TetR family transcriptional regulator n=1 Tax=Streptomyces agglomeratus TaxID=285458 RepID=A0A1E5PIR5_9ACTN|nr:TetR/AcrR family transcriptional regulator [Streptomyces agglomeratus]OEJ29451.1 TetR family transcriptional regulator [Streptomyces agglomeratus]OEJ42530.1 TetR family transcriptional regulator [Streptomyces agglomeratus]OEJ48958.1 TetR family transcriptional regulator [Streptomyces agglomeratus]OEJ55849.1 TetR family transcriptional regulator [Streptomyces agglomeratus]
MSAEERRESVIRAAITEFARGGYNGTSTEAIARRVGVSQPYLFRLFKNKQELFLAAATRCLTDTRLAMAEAARGLEGEDAHMAMAEAYKRLIVEDPDRLLLQMQMFVAVSAAEAAGEHAFGEPIRAGWEELWDSCHLRLGADEKETAHFMSFGMLINVLVSLGFPAGHRVWSGFDMTKVPVPKREQ